MGIGVKIAQALLVAFNLVFVLIGLAGIVVGAIIRLKYDDYEELSSHNVGGVSILLIALGGIIFIVSFFGCCGAIRKSVIMLTIFVVLLVILLVIEIAAAITAYVYKDKMKGYLEDGFNDALDNYNNSDYRKALDTVQKDFDCCGGTDGPASYTSRNITIPSSCCAKLKNGTSCNEHNAYKKGCVDKLFDYLEHHLAIVGGLAVGVAVIQVIGIIFACVVRRDVKEGYNYV
ncbi:CD63 antigen-like [Dendronephthya gigantea]|uniref:CD63 antigen-like n=1 Tax=Dendronephthya gigantea TaxID=151771 RepID=UPI00106BA4EA|nr:CD63 antigen-like [Dendronephthya gigantea]